MPTVKSKWPKTFPPFTPEQQAVREDFMQHWHEVLPARFGVVERFNHGWPARTARAGERTLEIGSGLGEHLASEPRFAREGYVASELRPEMAERIRRRHPDVEVLAADCQERIPYEDESFDRVLAIHVLEHLPNLPAALAEVHRLLRPSGRFVIVIPCEGGAVYSLARRVSAQRVFERRYKMPYDWFIKSEHINLPAEIREECGRYFRETRTRYFPFVAPVTALNLAIGIELTPLPR
jgi:SAM-dependent methyltransferase